MRVAIVTEYLDIRGGTQRVVLNLAQGLQARGHDVRVFTAALGPACFPELQAGLTIHAGVRTASDEIPEWRKVTYATYSQHLIQKVARFKRLIDEQREAERRFLALFEAYGRDIEVWNPHESGGVAWACLRLRTDGRGVVWQCNEPIGRSSYRDFQNAALRKANVYLQYLYPPLAYDRYRMRRIRCVSVLDHRVARQTRAKFSVEPDVVRCGVTNDWLLEDRTCTAAARDRLRHRIGLKESDFLVGAIGHWYPVKRYEDVLRAIARIPRQNIHYLVHGPTAVNRPYADLVYSTAREFGLEERFHVIDGLPRDDHELRSIYDGLDLFVYPCWSQTWGLAVIESMSRNLPTIVSRGSGAHEVVQHGETGFLYQSGDTEALASILSKLQEDPDLCKTTGAAAGRYVAAHLTFSLYLDRMEALMKRSLVTRA
jgi:glycosyltransferase involved in cell wall biosynthesis